MHAVYPKDEQEMSWTCARSMGAYNGHSNTFDAHEYILKVSLPLRNLFLNLTCWPDQSCSFQMNLLTGLWIPSIVLHPEQNYWPFVGMSCTRRCSCSCSTIGSWMPIDMELLYSVAIRFGTECFYISMFLNPFSWLHQKVSGSLFAQTDSTNYTSLEF